MSCPCCQPAPQVTGCCGGEPRQVPRSVLVQLGPFLWVPHYWPGYNTLCPGDAAQTMLGGTYSLPLFTTFPGNAFYQLVMPTTLSVACSWRCAFDEGEARVTMGVGVSYCRWPNKPRIGCYGAIGQGWAFKFVDTSSPFAASYGATAPTLCGLTPGVSATYGGRGEINGANMVLTLFNSINADCDFSFGDYYDTFLPHVAVTPVW